MNINTFEGFVGSFVRKREFDCVNKKCNLELFKYLCIFQACLSNVVELQSSRLTLLAGTNTLALNTTLIEWCYVTARYAKRVLLMRRIPSILLTWMSGIQNVFKKLLTICMYLCPVWISQSCRPYRALQFLIGDTCYYYNQECGDFLDPIGKSMLKSMHVYRSSVLDIDWNIF